MVKPLKELKAKQNIRRLPKVNRGYQEARKDSKDRARERIGQAMEVMGTLCSYIISEYASNSCIHGQYVVSCVAEFEKYVFGSSDKLDVVAVNHIFEYTNKNLSHVILIKKILGDIESMYDLESLLENTRFIITTLGEE